MPALQSLPEPSTRPSRLPALRTHLSGRLTAPGPAPPALCPLLPGQSAHSLPHTPHSSTGPTRLCRAGVGWIWLVIRSSENLLETTHILSRNMNLVIHRVAEDPGSHINDHQGAVTRCTGGPIPQDPCPKRQFHLRDPHLLFCLSSSGSSTLYYHSPCQATQRISTHTPTSQERKPKHRESENPRICRG